MGCLPEELIEAILVRVPVKYLLQFKCVSKYWLNLISSPEFVKASWTKLYTIRYPENYELSPPLFTYNKGEILLAFKSTLAIYDPKNDSITYPKVPNVEVTGVYNRNMAELCIESLVCPDLPNED
ncbi:hypothetical protein MTR67_022216 [Solanum verrucosum]|uniref:F-box domain-containing protein n=1 Tax=Solanum verrucosum TaxID=315347 RepID=A0AAF0QT13_SOLVR|nr:hypothetical protein MTR67_022216 [Solanum verrucosum]